MSGPSDTGFLSTLLGKKPKGRVSAMRFVLWALFYLFRNGGD
jgi:hypothetical protein